jgi:hypothetical protein
MAKPARELPPLHRPLPVSPARSNQHQVAGVIVGAKQLARHLDLTHPRIGQLAEEQVLERLPDGKFNLDAARVAYIRWLRDAERRTAKSKVDSDFVRAKTELIAIRVREKRRTLMETSEAMEMMEQMIGTVLTHMGSMPPRVARLVEGNSSLVIRREVEKIVFDTRTDMANQFNEFAKWAEEPSGQQKPATDNTEKEDDAA